MDDVTLPMGRSSLKILLIIIAVMVVVIVSSLYITTLPNYDKPNMEPILAPIGLTSLMVIIGILLYIRWNIIQ